MVEGLGDRELLTSWQPGSKGRVQEEEAANLQKHTPNDPLPSISPPNISQSSAAKWGPSLHTWVLWGTFHIQARPPKTHVHLIIQKALSLSPSIPQSLNSSSIVQKSKSSWVPVACAYNPSYSGGRDQEDQDLKPARPNSFETLYKKIVIIKITKKGLVECMPRVQTPVTHTHTNKLKIKKGE
jgi:hypothetical protein